MKASYLNNNNNNKLPDKSFLTTSVSEFVHFFIALWQLKEKHTAMKSGTNKTVNQDLRLFKHVKVSDKPHRELTSS